MSDEPFLGFSPKAFARRRTRVQEALHDAVLVLPASPIPFRSRDTEYPYRPDSELFYLTGCTEPGVVAVLGDPAHGPGFTLFVPGRNPKEELWSGPRMGPEGARDLFGADRAYPLEELNRRLPELLSRPRTLYVRLGGGTRVEELVLGALRRGRSRGPRKGDGPRAVVDPGALLDPLRLRKDPEEVARIRRAAELTVQGFREAMAGARPGMGEWELEAVLDGAFRRGGGRGAAFPTIVGSGLNGCVLHYARNGSRMEGGELVLVDGGAELDLYAGDVSRTFPVGGVFSRAQGEAYKVVLAALRAGREAVGPGAPVSGIHHAAVRTLTRGLVELGILKGKAEDLIREKAYEPFFPHQTSHWLGLDVHDVGDYAQKGESVLLEPGMVLTVEPGLYFRAQAREVPAAFRGMGIRLEDDLLVTETGSENLTAGLPVEMKAVEGLLQGVIQ